MPEPESRVPAPKHSPRTLYAGTSGWAYPTWKPGFYPPKLPAKRFLEHYSGVLNTVEVNYTFRTLPSPAQLGGWLAATGPAFRFAFKAPQRITHWSRLRDCEPHLQAFLAALLPARDAGKLGPLLFQLPPNLQADAPRLRDFLESPSLGPGTAIAFEFRHASWFTDEIFTLLADHHASLSIADTDDLKTPELHLSPAFTCFRLRRDGGYTEAELKAYARRLRKLAAAGRDVYVHFRHQEQPTGALNAVSFLEASHAGRRAATAGGAAARETAGT